MINQQAINIYIIYDWTSYSWRVFIKLNLEIKHFYDFKILIKINGNFIKNICVYKWYYWSDFFKFVKFLFNLKLLIAKLI
jgi:hypothetical protein